MKRHFGHDPSDERALFHAFIETSGTVLAAAEIRELEQRQRTLAELASRMKRTAEDTLDPVSLTSKPLRSL
ncbi:MAG: hypothetical protein AAFY56_23325 [Pseudomonadota bacterium]